MSAGIVRADDLHVLREPLLERCHGIRAHADGMHLVSAALPGLTRQLPDHHVQQFVREDLVHRAETPCRHRAMMEVHVPCVRLRRAVQDEAEPREAALLRGQQQVGRLLGRPRLPPEVILFERVESKQPAGEPVRKDALDFSRRTPDKHRQSRPRLSRRSQHHQPRRRPAEGGRRQAEQAQEKDAAFHGRLDGRPGARVHRSSALEP